MEHGDDRNFFVLVIDLINNDIRESDDGPFVCSGSSAKVSRARPDAQTICGTPNARHDLATGAGVTLGDLLLNMINIEQRTPPISDLHRPHFRQSAATSSSVA